jgi:hypothetical protein
VTQSASINVSDAESILTLSADNESARHHLPAGRAAQVRDERLRWRRQMSGQPVSFDDQATECYGCGRPYPRRDLAGVAGLPGYRWPRYCPACVEALRAAYARRCALCGAAYWAATPANPARGEVLSLAVTPIVAGLCPACETPVHAREWARVRSHLARAAALGLPATLTLAVWLDTLAQFDHCCAYCGAVPFTDLDHFIPLSAGGGTTADNCVPACARCNSLKGAATPTEAGAGSLPAGAVARAAAYLQGLDH